ncbi:uncharacterized protein LOC130981015 [Arachis stenosperma]|uniref:uncharacterized protein LOC130981015 n=1 Tax=Arachis stenosperma TaxID=217475 RepID=UPI0025ABB4A1|nr:uncharacterized protein LOC130981015 [Arachis stenosperma]
MPLYAKFLKELMTIKRNWGEKETVVLTEECSAIIQKKLPRKMKDPRSFQIPYIIGDITIKKALCDLGASINLMSLNMMRMMRIEEAKPTRMTLQLADRTFKFPHGVVEDLLVKVGEFIFPANFVVMDMEEEANTSIILGRPFLTTAGAIIDVQKGELVLRLHEEKLVFNVFKAMNYPKEVIGECMMVDTIEQIVQGVLKEEQYERSLELEQQTPREEPPQGTMESSIMTTHTDNNGEEAPKLELNPTSKLEICLSSPSVSPVQVVPKKGGVTVVPNKKNELIPTRTVTGWHMCIDYRKLNEATRKDHFPLLFMDQMLERLAGHEYYCFFDGYSGYNQIVMDPKDQEKTSFTCPYGVFAYKRMPFGLCNAPATFQSQFQGHGELPTNINKHMRRKLIKDAKYYIWDEPYLFKKCTNGILRRCISHGKGQEVLWQCHGSAYGGHFSGERTAAKVLQCGFYWPSIFKDAKDLVSRCDKCQRAGNLPMNIEMPQRFIMELELFDVWGIDFMGPFPSSYSNSYILVAVNYVSKWVEAIATAINDNKVVMSFLRKNIFSRFGVPRALISDGGTHFCNKQLEALLLRYGVKQKVATPYHP